MYDIGDLAVLDSLARISVAVVCGAVLGWEREANDKPAGLRTNMMVALGAATATMAALKLHHDVSGGHPNPQVGLADPIRIVSGVVGGLGFLGAGTIIQARGSELEIQVAPVP